MYAPILTTLIGLTLSCVASSPVSEEEWSRFKVQHKKVYLSKLDENEHQAVYEANRKMIDTFNRGQSEKLGFSLKLNKYSDLTVSELAMMKGFRASENQFSRLRMSPTDQEFLDKILNDTSEVPDEVDWRKTPGRVSSVKNQGACGSCWAFATVGILEGQELVRKNHSSTDKLIDLSPQNILDCSKKGRGCQGGDFDIALESMADEGGIDPEKFYKYEQWTDFKCRFNSTLSVIKIKGAAVIPEGDEESLKKVVARYGPVGVGISVTDKWTNYKSGVYVEDGCRSKVSDLDHAILIVGYGTDKKYGDYWIVKNSWGDIFGEDGYIKMGRNRNNLCGIATIATIATF